MWNEFKSSLGQYLFSIIFNILDKQIYIFFQILIEKYIKENNYLKFIIK